MLLPSCPASKPLHAALVFLDSSLHNSLACEQVPMLLKPLSTWLQAAYIVRNPATPCLPAWIVSIEACCKPVSRIHQKPRGPAVALQKSSRYVKGMDSTPASQRRAADELRPLIEFHAINLLLPSSLLWRHGLGCCRRLGLLVVHDCIALECSWVGNRCPPQIIMTCTGMRCVRQPLRVHRQHATLDVRATCTSNTRSTAAKEFPLDSTRALGAVNASCRTGQTHCIPPAYHRTAQRGGVGLPCPIITRFLQHQRLTVLEKPYIQRVRAQAPAMLRSYGDWSRGMCRS